MFLTQWYGEASSMWCYATVLFNSLQSKFRIACAPCSTEIKMAAYEAHSCVVHLHMFGTFLQP